jgi:hypothetical protein
MERTLSLPLVLVAFASFAVSVLLARSHSSIVTEKFLAPPPEHIELFAFGFNESMADSFWLRWIQDADYCQTYLAPVKPVDEAEIAKEDKLIANPRHRICDTSWAFKMLDTVTKLAPRFKMPYEAGAIALSVLVEDYEGATVLFDRGMKVYPNDWMLAYRAAYHYLYDKKDLPRAAELLTRAGDNGAPVWVKSLAARLYSRSGQIGLGISMLESYRATVKDNEAATREIDKRIHELKAQLNAPEP